MSVIVFDYDDTLFPNYLAHNDDEGQHDSLNKLDELIITIFEELLKCSTVKKLYVVTNSGPGWIKNTSIKFLPLTNDFMINGINHNKNGHKFAVVSARGLYEAEFPEEPIMWKVCTFHDIINDVEDDIKQFISFGDGIAEKKASEEMARSYPIIVKTIKFIDAPQTVDEVVSQLELVDANLSQILKEKKSLELNVTPFGDGTFFLI